MKPTLASAGLGSLVLFRRGPIGVGSAAVRGISGSYRRSGENAWGWREEADAHMARGAELMMKLDEKRTNSPLHEPPAGWRKKLCGRRKFPGTAALTRRSGRPHHRRIGEFAPALMRVHVTRLSKNLESVSTHQSISRKQRQTTPARQLLHVDTLALREDFQRGLGPSERVLPRRHTPDRGKRTA